MIGAIYGDIVGSRFEWRNTKTKDFDLFTDECHITDDSVMTCAVADAQIHNIDYAVCMRSWGRSYPEAGYGGRFYDWLLSATPKPYNSYGNGSGMRTSSVGWLYDSLEKTLMIAEEIASITHNHPEGIKGAKAISACIWLARNGWTKGNIKKFVVNKFGYNLSFTLSDIRDTYSFDVSCQGSVPQAINSFIESESFEDSIRNAISIGGDSDTIAAMTGSIAEAYYGLSTYEITSIRPYLDNRIVALLFDFYRLIDNKNVLDVLAL